MPTGPFKSTRYWQVYEQDGARVRGISSQVKIVRAREDAITYRRKDRRVDPMGMRRHRAKVVDWGYGIYRATVGPSQYIEAQAEPEPEPEDAIQFDMFAYHWHRACRANREQAAREQALERRRTMAAFRIQRFLRDTTCNPVYAAARRSLERLCLA